MAQGGGGGRATAIVVFTDLVGSTQLRSRLGEEAAEGLRRKHDSLLVAAIDAHRGKLVKNLGDGVMAMFTGASDAVTAEPGFLAAIPDAGRGRPLRRGSSSPGRS